ncbi:acyl-CoA dehydrogenase family protein [Kitasatospora sp. GAS1066B]|uniref:acyl-CoA dehydrogenase family protein n=1 Tax=Kitasatospora sp. GAS1066B TaxID=3156271 RepID=UPI0035164EC4
MRSPTTPTPATSAAGVGGRALQGLREVLRTVDIQAAEAAGRLPEGLLGELGERGLLLPCRSRDVGGLALNQYELGALCEELGGQWVSLLSVLTAHMMAAEAIGRWGNRELAATVLAEAAGGRRQLAFALSEPEAGSDAEGVRSHAEPAAEGYRITGVKTWLSGGQDADLFLVLAQSPGGPIALLVDRADPGVEVTPIEPLLGFRAAGLAQLAMNEVVVPARRVVGRPASGLRHVAATALDHGRFCLAWGGVGLAQASLRNCADRTAQRHQFGSPLLDHQLVRAMLSDMLVETAAARLLCAEAARLREEGAPEALVYTSMAKYRSARTAARATRDALQLHGAFGTSAGHPVERAFRDAKLLELVEGTEQIHQATIAGHIQRLAYPRVDGASVL